MAEILPRNIVVSLIVVMFAFTAGVYLFTGIYDAQSANLPDQVSNIQAELSDANNSVNILINNTENEYDSESGAGWVSNACTTLLGDDNFFCAGISTLGSLSEVNQNAIVVTSAIEKSSKNFGIPTWVWATINSIIGISIIFIIISAFRRYRS